MDNYSAIIFLILYSTLAFAFPQFEIGDIDLKCPRGSYRLDDLCYSISITRADYDNSERACQMRDGTLAMVKTEKIHLFLERLKLKRRIDYWFGLMHNATEKIWHYSDGSDHEGFFKWAQGEPNNYRSQQHCGKLESSRSFLWDDDFCTRQYRYICQFEGDNCENRPSLGSYCFQLSTEFKNFSQANEQCRLNDGYLAQIKSQETYDFLKYLIYNDRSILESSKTEIADIKKIVRQPPDTWIGFRQQRNWVHSDGSEMNFTLWAPGEPNNRLGIEDCVVMRDKWHDFNCFNHLHEFACQYNISSNRKDDPKLNSSFHRCPTIPNCATKLKHKTVPPSPNTTFGNVPVVASYGVHLSTGNFILSLIGMFLLGMLLLPCIWGINVYFKCVKKIDGPNDGEILRMRNDDES